MKNVAVLLEDGAFALFFRPHPGEFDSSKVPTPRNLPSKAKKNANALCVCVCVGGGGWVLGTAGIGWCFNIQIQKLKIYLAIWHHQTELLIQFRNSKKIQENIM